LGRGLFYGGFDHGCFSDLFYVCVPGEAADITTAPAEAEDEGHQKPRPLQSTKYISLEPFLLHDTTVVYTLEIFMYLYHALVGLHTHR